MTQIKNKFDIQNSIADEMLSASRSLPNFFNYSDEMKTSTGLILSLVLHGLLAGLIMLLSALGIAFPKFDLPELPQRDIEFKLVQQESKPPINKNTKIRADRDSQAGGKHDPKRAISQPTPKGANSKPAPQAKAQPQKPAKKEPQKQVQKQPQKPAVQTPKQQPKQPAAQTKTTPQKQQNTKPAVSKPSAVKAPNANLKPANKPTNQGVAKPSAPKIPMPSSKGPFAIPTPSSSPAGGKYAPTGAIPTRGSSGGSKGSSAPAPKFSSSGGSKGASGSSSGGSYASRGSSGGFGSGGNPSPGNPNGAPGIDAIKQPNWGPYMRDLEQRIKRNWTPPKGDSSKRVVITFTISRDGRLLNKRIVKSSGVPLADRAAMSAIEQTAPFRPLPPEFKGQSVPIEFTFDYNVLNSVLK
ncbi:MAG: TonB family protein [Candidatus Gastranaerophilales bacterium]|nr:TonB family protein [Candidatus Gastranaerophilales bacterium]